MVQDSILTNNFFFVKMDILAFFAIKLGHFRVNALFAYATKWESLTAKIGNERKQFLIGSTPADKLWQCLDPILKKESTGLRCIHPSGIQMPIDRLTNLFQLNQDFILTLLHISSYGAMAERRSPLPAVRGRTDLVTRQLRLSSRSGKMVFQIRC